MIPLLLTCTALTAAIAAYTVWLLRKLTRPWFSIEVDISKATESLAMLSLAFSKAANSFDGLSDPYEK